MEPLKACKGITSFFIDKAVNERFPDLQYIIEKFSATRLFDDEVINIFTPNFIRLYYYSIENEHLFLIEYDDIHDLLNLSLKEAKSASVLAINFDLNSNSIIDLTSYFGSGIPNNRGLKQDEKFSLAGLYCKFDNVNSNKNCHIISVYDYAAPVNILRYIGCFHDIYPYNKMNVFSNGIKCNNTDQPEDLSINLPKTGELNGEQQSFEVA